MDDPEPRFRAWLGHPLNRIIFWLLTIIFVGSLLYRFGGAVIRVTFTAIGNFFLEHPSLVAFIAGILVFGLVPRIVKRLYLTSDNSSN
jgi:hypothetical protein